MKRKRTDEYWAGIFDGEGTVGIYAVGERYWAAKLSVVGTYRPMIEALSDHFGVGSLSTQKRQALQQTPRGKVDLRLGRQGWRWSVTRREELRHVLTSLRPWLLEKAEQADLVLAFLRGEIDGARASARCKALKRPSFPASLGESPRKTTTGPAHNRRLQWKQAQDIKRRYAAGEGADKLARKFKVNRTTIFRMVRGDTYTQPPVFRYESA